MFVDIKEFSSDIESPSYFKFSLSDVVGVSVVHDNAYCITLHLSGSSQVIRLKQGVWNYKSVADKIIARVEEHERMIHPERFI